MRNRVVLCLFCVWASCASAPVTEPPVGVADPSTRDADVEAGRGDVAAAAANRDAGQGRSSVSQATLDPTDLAVWQSPEFKRRFLASYLAETDIEPRVEPEEVDALAEVFQKMAADQPEQAAELLQKHRGKTSSAAFDCAYANLRFQQDRLAEAEAAYRIAVDKHPKFRRAWTYLAQIHYRNGDHPKAIAAFSEVIKLGGRDALTYGLLGVCHLKSDNSVAAESAFRVATMLEPNNPNWKMGLAESFFKQGRYADATAHFGKLVEQEPDRPELWLAQGEAFAMMKQPLRAAENFEIVDRLGKSTGASLGNLGDIYANEGLYDLAVGAYLRALSRQPDAKPDRLIRAATFLSQNGARDATEQLVVAIEKGHEGRLEAKQQIALLRLRARIALARGAGEKEAEILAQIVDLDPLDGEALILLGQHCARQKAEEQAVHYFERAASIEGFGADARVRHAQLLVGQAKYGAALPLLRRAQEIRHRANVQEFLDQVERAARNR